MRKNHDLGALNTRINLAQFDNAVCEILTRRQEILNCCRVYVTPRGFDMERGKQPTFTAPDWNLARSVSSTVRLLASCSFRRKCI